MGVDNGDNGNTTEFISVRCLHVKKKKPNSSVGKVGACGSSALDLLVRGTLAVQYYRGEQGGRGEDSIKELCDILYGHRAVCSQHAHARCT